MKKISILVTALSLALTSTNIIKADEGHDHGDHTASINMADLNGTWKVFTNKEGLPPHGDSHDHDSHDDDVRIIQLHNVKYHAGGGHHHPEIEKKLNKKKKSILNICAKDGNYIGGKLKQGRLLTGENTSKIQFINSTASSEEDASTYVFWLEDPVTEEVKGMNFIKGEDGRYWLSVEDGNTYLAKKLKGKKRNNPKYCKKLAKSIAESDSEDHDHDSHEHN